MRTNKSTSGNAGNVQLIALCLFLAGVFSACEMYSYGKLGGADQTGTLRPYTGTVDEIDAFEDTMSFMSGVWYSHRAGTGRLDGYRIGKWKDFKKLIEDSGKDALFPSLVKETYTTETGSNIPDGEDFFVMYDDTPYGQSDDGTGGSAGWGFGYMGIVRAVNHFNGDPNRGPSSSNTSKAAIPNGCGIRRVMAAARD